nr:MAG: hypothetical protein 1 [Leviviridae sp.]
MGKLRTRKQSRIVASEVGESWFTVSGVPYPKTKSQFVFTSGGKITDELHAWPPGIFHPESQDIGGGLLQEKFEQQPHGRPGAGMTYGAHSASTSPRYYYTGPQYAYVSGSSWENQLAVTQHWRPSTALSTADLIGLGATAISRCAPTNPHASLSVTLGELRRDGIPAIPALRAFQKRGRESLVDNYSRRRSQVGSEHLNIEFGWKPLLNDVRKLATAARTSTEVINQYLRDSGKLVHRRYEFPLDVVETTEDLGLMVPSPPLNTYLYEVLKGQATRTRRVTRRIWFEGDFTYMVAPPEKDLWGLRKHMQMANHLLGAGITPAVLYDLTPWTWAADWFTNTGDVINNISMLALDGLVVVRGYIMCETITQVTVTNNGAQLRGSAPMYLTQTWTSIIRQRQRATPFGFGVNLDTLSARQIAIVAALGLSRDGNRVAR